MIRSVHLIAYFNLFRKLLLFFLFTGFFTICKGQNTPIITHTHQNIYARFTNFSSMIGENHKIVKINQDKYGYIWLAGNKGLIRFDGKTAIKYINDWTPGSLPSSQVNCITTDYFGRLWAGTDNGLCFYNYNTGTFNTVFGSDTVNKKLNKYHVRTLISEGDTLLWMTTLNGFLWKIDLKTLKVLKKIKFNPTSQPYYTYGSICRYKGNIWFGERGIGPYILNKNENKAKSIKASHYKEIPGVKRGYDTGFLLVDNDNNLWVGSTDGIYCYDNKTEKFNTFMRTSSWAATLDHKGTFWFAGSNGILHYFPKTGKMITYSPNGEDPNSLAYNYVTDIFEDSYHQIWVATGNGVSVLKTGNQDIRFYFHIPAVDETPVSSSVTAIVQDTTGMVWVGTSNGIEKFDPLKQTFKHFTPSNTKGLPSGKIRALQLDANNNLYCGLWSGKGFGVLHPHKKSFTLYTYNKNNTNSDWYSDMVFDKSGKLYLGFWGGSGLTPFDTKKEQFGKSLKNKFQNSFLSRRITALEIDSLGNIWTGCTRTGLFVYMPDTDTTFSYLYSKTPGKQVPEAKIFDITNDNYGRIWISAGKLYTANINNQTIDIININTPDVYAVLPENKNNIWLMTEKGLLKLNLINKSLINYSSHVKLLFSENNAAGIKLKDGRLMFGGENGIAIFNPDKVNLSIPEPHVFLSSLMVFNKTKIANTETLKNIELTYKENFFSINIGSNAWNSSHFNYYYKLSGFNKDWISMPEEQKASFTNVPPGKYHFKIMVKDKLGNQYPDIAGCNITIWPPFWKRWWFVITLTATILLIILLFIHIRLKETQLALANSNLNMKLLRLQMNPHFIFNSLFAIQNFIYSKKAHEAGTYLSDFAHLIRLILDNSRKEYINFDKELETISLYLKLQKIRFNNKFDYKIVVDNKLNNDTFLIPPMLAQPFLENAIEHGLKNFNGQGVIIVKYELVDTMIRFSVKDNGIGLTAGNKQKKQSKQQHESLAIAICKQRLNILKKQKKSNNITFVLKELKNIDGTIGGTYLSFNIPI